MDKRVHTGPVSPATSTISNQSIESRLEEEVHDKVPAHKLFKLAIRFNKGKGSSQRLLMLQL